MGLSLHPVSRLKEPSKFRIGNLIECRQTGLRFTVVGTPNDCEYLPTGDRVYLCCEDTLDRRILVIPSAAVEADMAEVMQRSIRDRMPPRLDRRVADRRTSNGTRPAGDPD